MQSKNIKQLADDLYEDADVAAAVIADAERADTTERIESGELNLPSQHDARIWYARQQQEAKSAEAKADKAAKRGGK